MSAYRSLATLFLAGSLTSCNCLGKIDGNFKGWREKVAEEIREEEQREHAKKKGYLLCEKTYRDCFSVDEAQELEKAGIKAVSANPLVFMHAQGILKWQEDGCKLNRFPALLKEAESAGFGQGAEVAGYYALAACTGKTTLDELKKYDPRFRESRPRRKPAVVYLAEHNVDAQAANAFPPTYDAREIVALSERGKNADVAIKYAELKQAHHLLPTQIADLDDQHISPETARWYFDLEKTFLGIDMDISDVIVFEKAVKEKKITRRKVQSLAQKVSQEDPLLELLRKRTFTLSNPESDI